jgi:putative addiction module component (TIGR02574 family)
LRTASFGTDAVPDVTASYLARYLIYAKEITMIANLRELPIDERIRLVEDLWDSIAADQATLPLKAEQREELDRRLDAYESDGHKGRLAAEAIADIRRKL